MGWSSVAEREDIYSNSSLRKHNPCSSALDRSTRSRTRNGSKSKKVIWREREIGEYVNEGSGNESSKMEDGRDKNVRIVSRDGASPERDAMARKKEKKKKKKRERKEREGVVNERAREKMTIKQ